MPIVSLPDEIWVDIPNYEGLYKVSNLGRFKALDKSYNCGEYHACKRFKKEHILKFGKNKGYLNIALSKDGKATTFVAHRIVGITFIPNPENKPEINHRNGDKHDLRVNNLEWSTRSENIQHAFDNGFKTSPNNGEHPMAKIVLDTQTGIFYDCAKEAALAKNIKYHTVLNHLGGFVKTNTTGLIYV